MKIGDIADANMRSFNEVRMSMLARLVSIFLCLCCLTAEAQAQVEPEEFKNIDVAKAWFSKNYLVHDFEVRQVKVSKNEKSKIFAFYTTHGSGVIRVNGWFYGCSEKGPCQLRGMLDLGRAKFQKGPPKISYQLPYLVIESEEETRMRLRVDR